MKFQIKKRGIFVAVVMMTGMLWCTLAMSAPAQGEGDSELAKQSQNPVANLISIPFQNNMNFGLEPNHRTQNVLNIVSHRDG